jgi:hypothetical protein
VEQINQMFQKIFTLRSIDLPVSSYWFPSIRKLSGVWRVAVAKISSGMISEVIGA